MKTSREVEHLMYGFSVMGGIGSVCSIENQSQWRERHQGGVGDHLRICERGR